MSDAVQWNELLPRERDALVAEKVMEYETVDGLTLYRWVRDHPTPNFSGRTGKHAMVDPDEWYRLFSAPIGLTAAKWTDLPKYTTDIAAAWEVVEKMPKSAVVELRNMHEGVRTWHAEVWLLPSPFASAYGDGFVGNADTAPEAICIAALRACGVEMET